VLDEDASNLSSGQKQLLTIARAFLANQRSSSSTRPPATSTPAPRSSSKSHGAPARGSHQLRDRAPASTIREANTIIVMDHGKIVEQGSHATLMQNRGLYYSLYQSQFTEATT